MLRNAVDQAMLISFHCSSFKSISFAILKSTYLEESDLVVMNANNHPSLFARAHVYKNYGAKLQNKTLYFLPLQRTSLLAKRRV